MSEAPAYYALALQATCHAVNADHEVAARSGNANEHDPHFPGLYFDVVGTPRGRLLRRPYG